METIFGVVHSSWQTTKYESSTSSSCACLCFFVCRFFSRSCKSIRTSSKSHLLLLYMFVWKKVFSSECFSGPFCSISFPLTLSEPKKAFNLMVFVNLLNDKNCYSIVLAMRIPLVSPLMLLLDIEHVSKWSMWFDNSACHRNWICFVCAHPHKGAKNQWHIAILVFANMASNACFMRISMRFLPFSNQDKIDSGRRDLSLSFSLSLMFVPLGLGLGWKVSSRKRFESRLK